MRGLVLLAAAMLLADTASAQPTVQSRYTRIRDSACVELPRNDGGKVRKQDLAELFTAPGTAPLRTADELALGALWAKVLSAPDVAADANFFALGGDSFRAADLATAVADAFGVDVPTTFAFDLPDLAGQAAWLVERRRG